MTQTKFDPDNLEHLKAYKHLSETGRWPEHIRFELSGPLWHLDIQATMANKWVDSQLAKEKTDDNER